MKKRLLVGRIIGIIAICIFAMGISYVIMHYVEKNRFENTHLIVTFEDTKEFTLENTNKLDKSSALLTYPYIFTIENKGKSQVPFELKLKDQLEGELKHQDLDYIIVLNDKEVKSGNLEELDTNNVLYKGEITKKTTDTYKVYIYLNKELANITYTYSLLVESK